MATVAPRQHAPLIGRTADLRRLDAFAASTARFCTLHGPGGIGKSALAESWLAARGVPFVVCSLGSCRDAREAFGALVITMLGPQGKAESPAQLGQLASARGVRFVLLDACEHLDGEAVSLLSELVSAADLRGLATSQKPLRVDGELVIEVMPLGASPQEGRLPDRDALFVSCVRRFRPDYDVAPNERPALARVGAALEGVPLAIELAAPWLKVTSLDGLAERLERGVAAALSATSSLTSHKSIVAAFDASHSRLSPGARDALTSLAVFVRSFDSDAAVAAIGGEDALAHLLVLRDASFVQQDPVRPERLSLFATVRELVLHRAEPAVLARATARHCAAMERVATRIAEALARDERPSGQMQLDHCDDLARAAMHLLDTDATDAAARSVRLLWAAFEALDNTRVSSRVRDVLERLSSQYEPALSALDRGRLELLVEACRPSLSWQAPELAWAERTFAAEPARRRAEIFWRCANRANRSRRHELVAGFMTAAVSAIEPVDAMEAAALRAHAAAYAGRGGRRAPDALSRADEAVRDLERLNAPPRTVARALLALASIAVDEAGPSDARAVLQRCQRAAERAGDVRLAESPWILRLVHAYDVGDRSQIATLLSARHDPGKIVITHDALVPLLAAMHALASRELDVALAALAKLDDHGHGSLVLARLLKARIALLRGRGAAPAPPDSSLDADEQVMVTCEEALCRALDERARSGALSALTRQALTGALAAAATEGATSVLARLHLRSTDPYLADLGVRREGAQASWIVSVDGAVFVTPDGVTLDVTRQATLVRVLRVLLAEHEKGVGGALDSRALADRAWAGERLNDTIAVQRVKATIGRLRKAGFGALIEHTRAGYRVRPSIRVHRRG